ncbi:MAG: hypothetical protein ACE37F_30440 [Nannocystaceae bacterium]|nr:hypothetical protein [bacterium]
MGTSSDAKTTPPRLHVLLARHGDRALVIRRGPSKRVCTIGWGRRTDTFELGQWLKGRIYERRCDLSPGGEYFIYFAMNGHWSSATGGSWTAISRTPWLRALVLLGKGDCWHGGGLFTGPNTYAVNDGYGHTVMRDDRSLRRDAEFRSMGSYGGECPGVYYNRLQRDGWTLRERQKEDSRSHVTVFEKSLPQGWTLRKFAREQVGSPVGKGCYWDQHALEHSSGTMVDLPDWEWAEYSEGELLFAQRGALYRVGRPGRKGLGDASLIRDFSEMRFEPRAAPYR